MPSPRRPWSLPFFPNHLFYLLCRAFRPQVICDIGSRDGAASRRFRQVSPHAQIIAFEANPENFVRMKSDELLAQANIQIEQIALSDQVGRTSFFAVENEGLGDWKSGAGSLYPRLDGLRSREFEVETTTLDRFLLDNEKTEFRGASFALWVDVEGAAFKVIEGAREVLSSTRFLQVEVERTSHWQGQKTRSDVDQILQDQGFIPFAEPRGKSAQFDAIYVASDLWRRKRITLHVLLLAAVILYPIRRYLRVSRA